MSLCSIINQSGCRFVWHSNFMKLLLTVHASNLLTTFKVKSCSHNFWQQFLLQFLTTLRDERLLIQFFTAAMDIDYWHKSRLMIDCWIFTTESGWKLNQKLLSKIVWAVHQRLQTFLLWKISLLSKHYPQNDHWI